MQKLNIKTNVYLKNYKDLLSHVANKIKHMRNIRDLRLDITIFNYGDYADE